MKKRTLAIAAVAALAFAGCLKNDGGISTPRAGLQVNLLSPNATSATIALDGTAIATNISYGSVPQYYNQVTAGTNNITVLDAASAVLLNANVVTQNGKFYSTFLVDSVSRMKAVTVADSVDYPLTTDSIKVRFFNFAPNSNALSVAIKDSGIVWNLRSFETQISADAHNTFQNMKAGTYEFQIFSPGSITPIKDTSISFEGKHIYTMFIKGFYPDTTGITAVGLGVVRHG